jgi:hypothetical protein
MDAENIVNLCLLRPEILFCLFFVTILRLERLFLPTLNNIVLVLILSKLFKPGR